MTSPDQYSIIPLANGDACVHASDVGETMHPVVGPLVEARTLYARQLKLVERAALLDRPMVIWDVGCGAGGNALVVLDELAASGCNAELISFDHTLEGLRFAARSADRLPCMAGWKSVVEELVEERSVAFARHTAGFNWRFHETDFPTWLTGGVAEAAPDSILYDAWSPKNNPAMWTLDVFRKLHARLDPHRPCNLATYSRSTLLRTTLLAAGFYAGRGVACGAKEETTVAANTPGLIERPLDRAWLEKAMRSSAAAPLEQPVYVREPLGDAIKTTLRRHPQFDADQAALDATG